MRAFDIVGGASVLAWIGVVGYFAYDNYVKPATQALEAGAIFREGESYMILTREDREVGYVHEARTHVGETDSWLLEYDLVMNVSMLGVDQYLETEIKATVNRSAILQEFSAAIQTAGTTFDLMGEVKDNIVTMSMDLGGQTRTQKIELREPARLSNSALNELVANEDLEPGTTFEQEYFDPTTMGMTTMTFEFVRRHELEVYGEKVQTFHFRQQVAGTELDAYVDKYGEVQLQEFPLRIVGARQPLQLGRARAQALKNKYIESKKGGGDAATDLSLEATVNLLRSGNVGNAAMTSRYRIHGIPDGVDLDLDSDHQAVTLSEPGVVEIDTARRYDGEVTEPELDPLLASEGRVDADHDSFAALLTGDVGDSPTLKAEMIARSVRKRMKAKPEIGLQAASSALEAGQGDCTEFSLVLVAALRHHGVPARFASGVKFDEQGRAVLHQWVQYWDGGRFIDLDATAKALLPGTSQIQLFTHTKPDKPELATIIDAIKIEKLLDAAPDSEVPEGDFN